MARTDDLIALLDGKKISSDRAEYHCLSADENCVIFGLSEDTGKVMLPTELILEWVQAFESGIITLADSAREMRSSVAPRSVWASYHHGFETHLVAIIKAWADSRQSHSN